MARLNTVRWGPADASRTVVALHGITANGGAMTEPARLLSRRGWRVIAPDMRGHGESTRANGDFSFDALLEDYRNSVPVAPDLLIGHSFGGTLAQLGVERGVFDPKALLLEDPVSVFADADTPRAMLDWDEANLPRTVDGLRALNPGWSALDAAWKLVSLYQIDFNDARAAFSGNAPWDLRPRAKALLDRVPTVWVLPAVSRFAPPEDQARLRQAVGERAVVVMPDVGHSVHRDATQAFVDIAEALGEGRWFA